MYILGHLYTHETCWTVWTIVTTWTIVTMWTTGEERGDSDILRQGTKGANRTRGC